MTTMQILIAVVAGILILSSLVDLKSVFNNLLEDKVTPKPVKPVIVDDEENNISSVVEKWESLKNSCDTLGLKQASAKLVEVFPLLAIKEDTNAKS